MELERIVDFCGPLLRTKSTSTIPTTSDHHYGVADAANGNAGAFTTSECNALLPLLQSCAPMLTMSIQLLSDLRRLPSLRPFLRALTFIAARAPEPLSMSSTPPIAPSLSSAVASESKTVGSTESTNADDLVLDRVIILLSAIGKLRLSYLF
jgi:hypothetical protein